MREFKSLPMFTKAAEGRTRVGICAVMGTVDDIDDRIHLGAFLKTISEGRLRHKHLWQHGFDKPPIATIKNLREVGREELPPEVIAYAPEATGGLEVTREYYEGNELAEWVLKAIDAGDINEMSFGFDPITFDFTTVGEGSSARRIRELREVRLYDTSDVLWGMNPNTFGAIKGMPLEQIALNLAAITSEIKSGRRNRASDLQLINAIHQASIDLGCDVCAGILEPEQDGTKAGTDPQVIPLSQRQQMMQLEIDAVFG